MPLLTRKTDLKSLKYGNDQPGGGNSGQPYQQVDINKVDSGFNKFRMTKFDDGLVRGGVVGAANAAIVDTFRIGKFLKDFPKGPLWLVKQVGLQLANPKLEAKQLPTGNATSGLGFFRNAANAVSNVVNRITNIIGPTRIYNASGDNTLAQVPLNAFGQHLLRFGTLPKRNNDILYFKTAQFNNQGNGSANRLVKLLPIIGNPSVDIDSYLGGSSSVYGIGTTTIRRRGDFITLTQDITANDWAKTGAKNAGRSYRVNGHGDPKEGYNNASNRISSFLGVSSYAGSPFAPDSFFGLRNKVPANLKDKTIQTYESTLQNTILGINNIENGLGSGSNAIGTYSKEVSTDPSKVIEGINKTPQRYKSTLKNAILGIENLEKGYYLGTGSNAIGNYPGVSTNPFDVRRGIDQSAIGSVKTYTELVKRIEGNKNRGGVDVDKKNVNQFNIYGDTKSKRTDNYTIYSPVSNETPTYYNGKTTITLDKTWRKIAREDRIGSGLQDQINLTPLFSASPNSIDDEIKIGKKSYNINDLVKFRIQALNGDNPTLPAKWMIFRAYVTSFSDGVEATWNSVKYAGRGEDFYVYGGFGRKINIGFKVAALSFDEMEPMYQKLNFLMGNLMPDYNSQGLMRGPMVKMTVGNWIDGQDGILNSLSYTVPLDSPWEIGLRVNNGIEPLILPHVLEVNMTFTPIGSQTKGVNKISGKSTNTSHIAQNVNDYQYIK